MDTECKEKTLECSICETDYKRSVFCDESVHNCFNNLKKHIRERKKDNPKAIFKGNSRMMIDHSVEIDGGGWIHVRHTPKGNKWHKAID